MKKNLRNLVAIFLVAVLANICSLWIFAELIDNNERDEDYLEQKDQKELQRIESKSPTLGVR